MIFLSTPSARRATPDWMPGSTVPMYFYPRPPQGGRLQTVAVLDKMLHISIHALRGEGDGECNYTRERVQEFLSTPSAGRATAGFWPDYYSNRISIHALRGEGDSFVIERGKGGLKFLSTPSAGRATPHWWQDRGRQEISIHALRGEGDAGWGCDQNRDVGFLSTPSAGRATPGLRRRACRFPYFYPRPPRGGRPRTSTMECL